MNAVLAAPTRSFTRTLQRHGIALARTPLEILQVNLTARCNLACTHCHVESGPKRHEAVDARGITRLIELMDTAPALHTLDLTGGAPELHPQFRELVRAGRARGLKVIDRCNLTVLFEPGQEDTAEFLAAQGVAVVASLPCYTPENVNKQRGKGVFGGSIDALLRLNALGYGTSGSGLELDLVYNPIGAKLPPSQALLENDYRQRLHDDFDITFNQLFTITNMPIKRFLHELERDGELDAYMQLLIDNFNPRAALGVMCRNLVSVGWDGGLYDCDFNQMLGIELGHARTTLWDIARLDEIETRPIAFAQHCYGCTAGAGSSCGGSLA
ncbi:arsenosugar biosynthesis radical SAM (seleno)protein ArsS [Thermomonas sp.]|uniref:arsenosugar biosynthesis radical SAM (seleno)protein ArsS n=1 Tax=Thermomonas sp. TaxID=1971895 RepID=UPI0024880419|nr:arsenosugar biosynthesis radical SAM (seleno)protein ArsS [Thermomonas sp.]MDI1254004.1 arsenosugar biosynthesis radical SAM protein ArsS [Thermomonas sp.]